MAPANLWAPALSLVRAYRQLAPRPRRSAGATGRTRRVRCAPSESVDGHTLCGDRVAKPCASCRRQWTPTETALALPTLEIPAFWPQIGRSIARPTRNRSARRCHRTVALGLHATLNRCAIALPIGPIGLQAWPFFGLRWRVVDLRLPAFSASLVTLLSATFPLSSVPSFPRTSGLWVFLITQHLIT